MDMDDYQLERFVAAQEPIFKDAVASIRAGRIDPAWLAVLFPRFSNCYHDANTERFAIHSIDEARAYVAHPILGSRLRESLRALSWLSDCDPMDVLSEETLRDLHSSLTLFGEASTETLMRDMLQLWFQGQVDETTITQLDLRG